MLNLHAYTPGQLQTVAALLREALHAGIDVGEILSAIDEAVGSRVEVVVESVEPSNPDSRSICPSCLSGDLVVCGKTTAMVGATVLACTHHCGYSRIVGGR